MRFGFGEDHIVGSGVGGWYFGGLIRIGGLGARANAD